MTDYIVKPIGIVKSKLDKEILKYANKDIKIDIDTAIEQGSDFSISKIIINEEYLKCLDGIEDFSHIIIFFWTHTIPDKARQIQKVHPAGLKDMPMKGIFATRSPVRPNPICITTVKLIERKGETLIVEGLDAINNTPVVDIKPHIPFYDSPLNIKLADWMYILMDKLKKLTDKSEHNKYSTPYSFDIRAHPCIHSDQKNINNN
ncbi:MAG: tRNA (N6-threonylcarbamoyladenosine(37)-N6)-methyltransferase TrmO [Candidatus Lokiarchaeota archaeon]|nr:tRNA (N6-threonylcarbamoyladenosine(37)-N6)-methyltransferase TrmO [Candidatus Lokiarchaeota archaeon]